MTMDMSSTVSIVGSQDSRTMCKTVATDLFTDSECYNQLQIRDDCDRFLYEQGLRDHLYRVGRVSDYHSILKAISESTIDSTKYEGEPIAFSTSTPRAMVLRLPEVETRRAKSYHTASSFCSKLANDPRVRDDLYSKIRAGMQERGENVTDDTPIILVHKSETQDSETNKHTLWVRFSQDPKKVLKFDCPGEPSA